MMKKYTQFLWLLAVLLSLALSLAGCGGGEAAEDAVEEAKPADSETVEAPEPVEEEEPPVEEEAPAEEAPPIEDAPAESPVLIEALDWRVEEGIVSGDRYMLLSLTNNTPYPLRSFELTFTERPDLTEEEKAQFYADIQKKLELSDEDTETLKERPISMHAESELVLGPGESVSDARCYYYGGSYYVKDPAHFQLLAPDIATIQYIDEGQIHTVYYDFSAQTYTLEDKTERADQWPDTELAGRIPKPDAPVLSCDISDEELLMFDAYGLSLEQFTAYAEACQALGYTVDPGSFEGFYAADDAEGYNIYLSYNERDHSMNGILGAPEEAESDSQP